MKEILVSVYRFFSTRRALLLLFFILLLGGFALLSFRLRIVSDLSAMLPKEEKQRDISKALTGNKQLDRLVANVSLADSNRNDPDLLVAYTEDFIDQLHQLDSLHLIDTIEARQDDEQYIQILQAIQHNLPFVLKAEDYTRLDSLVQPGAMQAALAANYRTLASPGGVAMKPIIAQDPLGLSFIPLKRLRELKLDESVELYDGYLFSGKPPCLTFFIHTTYPASRTRENEALGELLEQTRQALQRHKEYNQVEFACFGAQLVAAGNAVQMRTDTILTLSITILLLFSLFFFFFRNWLAPLQIMIPVVFGGLFGMAMMYLLKGSVSLIALGASSVILGIAVNYSLHFMSHLRHSGDREETIRELSVPMTIGSFTTIFAFLSLSFLHTPVLRELGLFTAFNLIGSSVCTLVFLPHFISGGTAHQHEERRLNWLEKLSLYSPYKSKWMVAGILVMTIVLSMFAGKVRFNEDMMRMNFMRADLKKSQDIINRRNSASLNTVFCISEGKTVDEALNRNAGLQPELNRLKQQGLIRKISSPADFLLSDSLCHDRLIRWNAFWLKHDVGKVMQQVRAAGQQAGFQSGAFDAMANTLKNSYTAPDSMYRAVFGQLLKDFIQRDSQGVNVYSFLKTTQEKRKPLFEAFESGTASYLTDRQLITSRFVQYIREDFYNILFLTSFIVFFTILISYGRIELALISFIPMVVTWICILGLMGLLGIEFNIINIILSTLIFGLGDDYSIFITDGLLEKYKYGKTKINSIKTSIYLSAITTIIGLGILIVARHPALRSIALVSVIGIFSILVVSQTLQPLLFNFFIQNRTNKKRQPFTFWSFVKTIFAFTYYVLGSTLITLIGFILTRCIPFAKDKMKYVYHVILCKGMWSLLYIMANTRKRIEGNELANFNEPAVIIANHSSFLDLLRIISLHPKILLLTNRWVWRSPVFGMLVRMADYYPVEEGAEFSVERLRYWVERGYSIAVFPEGTRSYDGEIKRFHKGAFYLAEQLHLPIQPVVMQGIGDTMSKGDFLLKDGEINIRFLPRIGTDDTRFGTHYAERAKLIGRYFRREYDAYRQERQTVNYYREQLIRNYQYKGPVLEWYCRIKSRLENNYETIEALLPREGHILDIGCGYGFLSCMLSWTSRRRMIDAIDYDEEKIEIASHGYAVGEQLRFMAMDALSLPAEKTYDGIVLLDVLHYLSTDQQDKLLDKICSLLNPGGVFVFRDGLADESGRIRGTQLSEYFSTRLFRFNKTTQKLHYVTPDVLQRFAQRHQLSMDIIEQGRVTSNTLIVFRKAH